MPVLGTGKMSCLFYTLQPAASLALALCCCVSAAGAATKHPQNIWAADPQPAISLRAFEYSYRPPGPDRMNSKASHAFNYQPGLLMRSPGKTRVEYFKYAGQDSQLRLGRRWRLDAEFPSTSANSNGFVVPIPRLTYDFGSAKLSTLYIPRIQDHELIAVFGIYLSIPLWQ